MASFPHHPVKCGFCYKEFYSAFCYLAHLQSREHYFKCVQSVYSKKRADLLKNKKGINISLSEGRDSQALPRVREERDCIVADASDGPVDLSLNLANGSERQVTLRQIRLLQSSSSLHIHGNEEKQSSDRSEALPPNCTSVVKFEVRNAGVRTDACSIIFEFQEDDTQEMFLVMKIVVVETFDDISEGIRHVQPYSRNECPELSYDRPKPNEYIAGVDVQGRCVEGRLLMACYYPPMFKTISDANFSEGKMVSLGRVAHKRYLRLMSLMQRGLEPENYVDWYHCQLWLEEVKMEENYKHYSLKKQKINVMRSKNKKIHLVELYVPGVVEKRPGVLKGDNLFFRPAGKPRPIYEGIVHCVDGNNLSIGFQKKLERDINFDAEFDVQFCVNRSTIMRKHEALEKCREIVPSLFPHLQIACTPPITESVAISARDVMFFDSSVRENSEQNQAVVNIINNSSAPHPYIVFGPPGTGKTRTLVEAIKQTFTRVRHSRILVCGPSNSSCDVITERLVKNIPKEYILRVNAASRDRRTLSLAVSQVSTSNEDGRIVFPPLEQLNSIRIIVSTFSTAVHVVPCFFRAGCGTIGFTHLFMDEVGHGEEPEALIPLLSQPTFTVLAGDPKQLGPCILSPHCLTDSNAPHFAKAGLDQSLLERFLKSKPYCAGTDGQYNSRYVTVLLNNYRSHASILKVPNDLFYNSKLQPKAAKRDVESMLGFNLLPNRNMPLIFKGVRGKDSREGNCPSYFNLHEVSEVINYVKALRKFGVPPSDVGIISPYKSQVHKVREALRQHVDGWCHNARVGSPEEFQGSESKVVIISTVRASAEHLYHDNRRQLGFLSNPKRFNVAVTRAKALVIIIGCPYILKKDENWNELLQFAVDNNCYTGCDLNAYDENAISKLSAEMRALRL